MACCDSPGLCSHQAHGDQARLHRLGDVRDDENQSKGQPTSFNKISLGSSLF
jgi:hypothetical protein